MSVSEELTQVTKITLKKNRYKINGILKRLQIYIENRVKAADYDSKSFIQKFQLEVTQTNPSSQRYD